MWAQALAVVGEQWGHRAGSVSQAEKVPEKRQWASVTHLSSSSFAIMAFLFLFAIMAFIAQSPEGLQPAQKHAEFHYRLFNNTLFDGLLKDLIYPGLFANGCESRPAVCQAGASCFSAGCSIFDSAFHLITLPEGCGGMFPWQRMWIRAVSWEEQGRRIPGVERTPQGILASLE